MEEQIATGVFIVALFLTIAVFSSIILKKINFPYTIGLVLVGGILGYLAYHTEALVVLQNVTLSPGLILYIILPILIFDAAFNVHSHVLWKNIVPILLLAVLALLISAGVIGLLTPLGTDLSVMGALVFGALISATDPVAVIALFNEIGAPQRLVTLIDGESIFNDATAIVLFGIVMQFATNSDAHVSILGASWSFISILLGGLLVGAIVGAIGAFLTGFGKNNILLQITVSLVMAYISFVLSDHIFGFSGVMSTLAAGIIMRLSSEKTVKQSNIESLENFWEYFSFVANSLVFLMLGLTEFHIFKHTNDMGQTFKMILFVIPVVLLARALGIYTLIPIHNAIAGKKDEKKKISWGYQAILFWGGLRGAVPVALVLAIPETFPNRDLIVHFTFGFILFTLLFQGTTIKALMDKLGIRPEESDFGDKEVVKHDYDFDNVGLAQIVMKALYDYFDDEGFFIKESYTVDSIKYLMKLGKTMFEVEQEKGKITLTCEDKDLDYFKTVLYEALLEIDKSVEVIKSVTRKDRMKDLVTSDTSGSPVTFNILKYIKKDRILVNITAKDKDSVIRELVQQLVEVGAIAHNDFDAILNDVIEREKSMSTGIGNGIAMPHAKSNRVKDITVLLAVSKKGVDFDAIDNKPVNFFVLIISPKSESSPHLKVLATMGQILSDEVIRQNLLGDTTPDKVYEDIKIFVHNNKK